MWQMRGAQPSADRRSFYLLLVGQLASQVGDAIFLTTLLLWVADLTDSSLAVGGLFIARALPIFAVSPFAGVFVDRWRYKPTLVICDLVRAALVFALLAVESDDYLPLIYLNVLLLSTSTRFFFPALMSSLPGMLGEADISRATSYIRSSFGISLIVGPLIAAPLYVGAGPELALTVNGASFLLSAGAIALCRMGLRPVAETPSTGGVWAEMGAGFGLILSSPLQRTVLIAGGVLLLGAGMLDSVNIFFIDEGLDSSRSFVGVAEGLQAAGYTLGALALAGLARRFKLWQLVGFGVLAIGFATLGYSQMTLLVPALALYSFQGLANGVSDTANQTLLVGRTPAGFRGRILSLHDMSAYGSLVVGAALGGVFAEFIGPRWIVTAAAVLFIAAGLYAIRALSRIPDEPADD